MRRDSKRAGVGVVGFAVALAACSQNSAPNGPAWAPGSNGSSGSNASTGGSSGGKVGSSGSATGSSSGSPGSGASSGGASGGASSGGSSSGGSGSGGGSGATSSGGSADAGSSTGTGCGQGTSCMPGTDLAPPAAGQGFQIATVPGSITVQPGQEQFLCYYKTLPNTAEVDVGEYDSWMTPGSSHHFITYQVGTGVIGGTGSQPDGTLQTCAFGGGTWMYATSVSGQIISMKMPDGVGLPLAAGTQVMLNMHFINPGSTPVYPQVKLNLLYVQNIKYKAAAMVSFNTSINVPAATSAGPGVQTVKGTCTAPSGANFFLMSTHTHKHATAADVNYISKGVTTNIVHTTDWEHPSVGVWNSPNFLTVQSGDSFTYSCTYSNSGSAAVTVGETAASNEMCMAIGYYFPAGNASCL
jgi:Copper type II ascorbate-dependent monooxygenase, C-terminal domain